jgi:hypothetical protein
MTTTIEQDQITAAEVALIRSLKALSAQASNAAYFLEHRHDAGMLATLANVGKTIDDRFAETIGNMRMFQEMVDDDLVNYSVPIVGV